MTKTYTVADLHGRYDLLMKALDLCVAHSEGKSATFVQTGDFIDRGPQAREIIQQLRQPTYKNLNVVVVRGNHEDIMRQAVDNPSLLSWWVGNGGGSTLYNYGLSGDDVWGLMHGEPTNTTFVSDLTWLGTLPYWYEDKHRIFVHAGLDEDKALKEQNVEYVSWIRSDRTSDGGYR